MVRKEGKSKPNLHTNRLKSVEINDHFRNLDGEGTIVLRSVPNKRSVI